MSRPRSLPLLAAALGASLALGACSSDGDDETDADRPSADDPTGVQGGEQADVPDALPGDAVDVPEVDTDTDTDTDTGAGAGEADEGGDPGRTPDVDPGEGGGTDAPDTDGVRDVDPGTPGDGAPLSGTASRVGLLAVNRGVDAEADGVFAAFYRLDEAVSLGDAGEALLPAPDTCTFESGGGDGGVDAGTGLVGAPDATGPGVVSLSAGEAIVLSGPGGTFATLPRTDAFGFVFYAPEGETLPGPIPSGLVADIPGDDYPAFDAVRIPDVPPLTGVTPAGLAGVTAGTTFGWDAGDDPEVRVIVDVTLVGPDPEVSITCAAADDGEFRLPASVRRVIPADQPAEAELVRVGVRALQRGDAVLLVTGVGTR